MTKEELANLRAWATPCASKGCVMLPEPVGRGTSCVHRVEAANRIGAVCELLEERDEAQAALSGLREVAQRVFDAPISIEAGVYAEMGSGASSRAEVGRQLADWECLRVALASTDADLARTERREWQALALEGAARLMESDRRRIEGRSDPAESTLLAAIDQLHECAAALRKPAT